MFGIDPSKLYGGRSGNSLLDLVAAISELRHCAMCAQHAPDTHKIRDEWHGAPLSPNLSMSGPNQHIIWINLRRMGASSLPPQFREAAGIFLAVSRQHSSKHDAGFGPITQGDTT